jgi:hypothetical protein
MGGILLEVFLRVSTVDGPLTATASAMFCRLARVYAHCHADARKPTSPKSWLMPSYRLILDVKANT